VDVIVLEEHDLHAGQTRGPPGTCATRWTIAISISNNCMASTVRAWPRTVMAWQSTRSSTSAPRKGIDCGFARVDGFLVRGENDVSPACSNANATPHAVPASTSKSWTRRRVRWRLRPGLRFPRQARFHALEYTTAGRAIVALGGRIHTRDACRYDRWRRECRRDCRHGARVQADAVVVATNVPFNDRSRSTPSRPPTAPTSSHCARPRRVPDVLLWDTLDAYHYVRLAHARNGTWLLVGGEDRKTGRTKRRWCASKCSNPGRANTFPMALDVGYRWSGQVICIRSTACSWAFLGHNPGCADKRVNVATGSDSGNGSRTPRSRDCSSRT
jgi:hypothetical protein